MRFIKIVVCVFILLNSLMTVAKIFVAVQLTPENSHRLPAGGMDAIGGVDDWLLSDGDICAVISAVHHSAYLSSTGGALIDLWHCDSANDQWVIQHDQHNLSKEKIPKVDSINASVASGRASINVHATINGIDVVTEYVLSETAAGRLSIHHTLRRTEEGDSLNMMASMVLHPRGALKPFTLDTLDGEYSVGFQQPYIDTSDVSNVVAAVSAADLQVLVGSNAMGSGISYGVKLNRVNLVDELGEKKPLHNFLIGSETFTMLGFFSEPFYSFSRKHGLLSFIRSQFMDLAVGESLEIEQSIVVGRQADVASVTDQIYQGRRIDGRLDTVIGSIEIQDPNGRPLSFVRAGMDGGFNFKLPVTVQGFVLKVMTPWSVSYHSFDGDKNNVGVINTGGFARIKLPRGNAMSLIFKGMDGLPDPVLMSELTGLTVGGEPYLSGAEHNRVSLAGIEADLAELMVAPGQYRVIASRGIEYDLAEAIIDLKAGEVETLAISVPKRVVNTRGLVAADLHVHSGISMDSSLLPLTRVIDFVAQGGEVMVTTEHNISHDMRPLIQSLGLDNQLLGIPGVELTGMARSKLAPTTIGHSNVFPVPVDDSQFMGGTLPFEGKRLGSVIKMYKEQNPQSLFQMNHPRSVAYDSDTSFFNHLSIGKSFDSSKRLNQEPNLSLLEWHGSGKQYRDIDFDALELLNGEEIAQYNVIKEDWFSFLRQGYFKVGTANSDSHYSVQLVALPRNYVAIDDSDLSALSAAKVVAAIHAGKTFGTTGPIIDVSFEGVTSGSVYSGTGGELQVKIDAAPWVGVNELQVLINGEVSHVLAVNRGESVTLDLSFSADSFITVEVTGEITEHYKIVAPGFSPIAFSNPIFIDVASDGYQYGH